jgi:hypothetical protein
MKRLASLRWLLLGVVMASSLGIGYALGDQPHMTAAIAKLEDAKAELQQAEHNKGGHREAAIKLIDQAIQEVKAGIAAAAS